LPASAVFFYYIPYVITLLVGPYEFSNQVKKIAFLFEYIPPGLKFAQSWEIPRI